MELITQLSYFMLIYVLAIIGAIWLIYRLYRIYLFLRMNHHMGEMIKDNKQLMEESKNGKTNN